MNFFFCFKNCWYMLKLKCDIDLISFCFSVIFILIVVLIFLYCVVKFIVRLFLFLKFDMCGSIDIFWFIFFDLFGFFIEMICLIYILWFDNEMRIDWLLIYEYKSLLFRGLLESIFDISFIFGLIFFFFWNWFIV